jgi:acyl-coenzyme A synthetase/AMP-(fatty) acid ligase
MTSLAARPAAEPHRTGAAPLPGAATVPFARELRTHGDRVALVVPDGDSGGVGRGAAYREVTYRELADRVEEAARRLGPVRRLVMLRGANELDVVVAYLAALAGGHPLLLVPPDSDHLAAVYDPDVVVGRDAGRFRYDERREGTRHDLHPDLALLLSTSGSTGSPKLVRLSQRNLQSNAEAIASYLGIRPSDRAVTSLPLHYCYGLSVVNSHLLRGASVILTDRSVADPEFWDQFRELRATSFAGVPYTFDLLDRVGFDRMDLPSLRYVTQAGGRLAPERVRRYAELGRSRGWDFVVMYGQTEATARMAYLPPHLAAAHPQTVGVPIPGGRFRLAPVPEAPAPDVGELVYEGPNVMLGYAETPADLSLGRTTRELYTGDLARRTPEGLYEIVGRRARFVKVFGLRVDLARVEAALERHGFVAGCAGPDDELVVVLETGTTDSGGDPDAAGAGAAGTGTDGAGTTGTGAAGAGAGLGRARQVAADAAGVPAHAVRVVAVRRLPRLANGKLDHRALAALAAGKGQRCADGAAGHDRPAVADGAAADPATGAAADGGSAAGDDPDELRRLFAEVLGAREVDEDSSFASLGGDSLSYVEMSVRLEQLLGHLPERWHDTPIRELRRLTRRGERRGPLRRRHASGAASLDTSVALRALSIIMIVGTHANLFALAGGAHLLLAVAGFNVARLHLTDKPRLVRVRNAARGTFRIAAASMVWIALAYLLTDFYSLANVFLLNYVLGSDEGRQWHFWFIETLVYLQLAVVALAAVPAVDRLDRRFPFGFPMLLVVLGLVTRYELIPGVTLATPLIVGWLFALGWAAARATGTWQRLAVTAAAALTVPGFFDNPRRDAIVIAGVAVLVWVSRVPSVRAVNRVAAVVARSSLYIYLTHWLVYPRLYHDSPLLAVVASLVVGIAYGWAAGRVGRRLATVGRRLWCGVRKRVAQAAVLG